MPVEKRDIMENRNDSEFLWWLEAEEHSVKEQKQEQKKV